MPRLGKICSDVVEVIGFLNMSSHLKGIVNTIREEAKFVFANM
jgi:hypothetical protein